MAERRFSAGITDHDGTGLVHVARVLEPAVKVSLQMAACRLVGDFGVGKQIAEILVVLLRAARVHLLDGLVL